MHSYNYIFFLNGLHLSFEHNIPVFCVPAGTERRYQVSDAEKWNKHLLQDGVADRVFGYYWTHL